MDIPFPLLYLTFLVVLLVGLIKRAGDIRQRRSNLPPSPWKLPLIGHMHHLIGSIPPHALEKLSRRFGPIIYLKLGQVNHIVISGPAAAREILKTHDLNFASRPQLAATTALVYGNKDIAFAPYGPYWRQLRKICVLELLSVRRVKSFGPIREVEVSALVAAIAASETPLINITEKVLLLTNTTTARAAFGSECKHAPRFITEMKKVMKLASGFNLADLYPSLAGILPVSAELERIRLQMDEILEEILAEHSAAADEKNSSSIENNEDLVDVLLRLKNKGSLDLEIPLSNIHIKAVIFDLFSAGTETTGTALVWAMAELMRNPAVMAKVQDEVRRAAAEKGKCTIEERDVEELQYMKMVIKETLRLHPPVPLLLPRICGETCNVAGFEIPAGSRLMINVWAMGRDPMCWGYDAEKFRPERFEEGSMDFKGMSFQYLPFGGGRRVCPGIEFALATAELTLAQLLFHFDWEIPEGKGPDELDMVESFGATMDRKLDLWLIATPWFPVQAAS